MPTQFFDIDEQVFKSMARLYHNSPKAFQTATAGVLNTLAFETRSEAIKVITTRMTSRRPGFTDRQMRYEKARKTDIRRQKATVGSVPKGSFTGWEEQETGSQSNRTHYATKIGRRGDTQKIIPAGHRLRAGMSFISPDDYPDVHTVAGYLSILERQKYRKPFKIWGKGWKSGLYKRYRGKVRMVQSFEAPKKTKKLPWMAISRRTVMASNPIGQLWERQLKFMMKPRRKT